MKWRGRYLPRFRGNEGSRGFGISYGEFSDKMCVFYHLVPHSIKENGGDVILPLLTM